MSSTEQPETAFQRQPSYSFEELLECAHGRLFGPGNAELPLPPMLMFDRITNIADSGGKYDKGQVVAEMDVRPDLWFFGCHFEGDPVMPGCLGLDALWQMLGFFLGWVGLPGKGRAISTGEVKFSGMVLPTAKKLVYQVDIKRLINRRICLGIGDGLVSVDGETAFEAQDIRVVVV